MIAVIWRKLKRKKEEKKGRKKINIFKPPTKVHFQVAPDSSFPPGDTIGDQEEMGVMAFLIDNATDIAENVGLLTAGGAISLGLDQDSRIIL